MKIMKKKHPSFVCIYIRCMFATKGFRGCSMAYPLRMNRYVCVHQSESFWWAVQAFLDFSWALYLGMVQLLQSKLMFSEAR